MTDGQKQLQRPQHLLLFILASMCGRKCYSRPPLKEIAMFLMGILIFPPTRSVLLFICDGQLFFFPEDNLNVKVIERPHL